MTKKMSMWLAIFAHSLCILPTKPNQTLHENVLNQLFFYDCYGYSTTTPAGNETH